MIDEVFDNLVEQFSDPFTFYRELIQNAMDAGSNRVEVGVEWLAERQMVVASVADQGEGMTLEIIRSQLTRLFSSSKENDLTKIGKFGIGFVSVFAIRPELVTVDTGRDGEFWRVVFDGSTDFQCVSLDTPVEGTVIRVYKPLPEDELEEFIRRSRDTISYWCRYSDNQVIFNGELLNEPLAVESPVTFHHKQPGTEIVCGFTSESLPEFGMYNRGLTLKEGRQEVYPGVTYRIKSRYLEHTLTRDNVLEDEQYHKAMAILDKTVRGELMASLFSRAVKAGPDELHRMLSAAMTVLERWRRTLARSFWNEPFLPCLHGPHLSINALRQAAFWEGTVYIDREPSRVSEVLAAHKIPVLRATPGTAVAHLATVLTGRAARVASRSVATPDVLEANQPRQKALDRLTPDLIALLSYGQTSVRRVKLANFHYEGSCVSHLPCLAQQHFGEPIRLYHRGFWRSLQKYPGVILLNHKHRLVEKALERAERSPRLASFVLAKAALLQDGLPCALEAKIVGRCLS